MIPLICTIFKEILFFRILFLGKNLNFHPILRDRIFRVDPILKGKICKFGPFRPSMGIPAQPGSNHPGFESVATVATSYDVSIPNTIPMYEF